MVWTYITRMGEDRLPRKVEQMAVIDRRPWEHNYLDENGWKK